MKGRKIVAVFIIIALVITVLSAGALAIYRNYNEKSSVEIAKEGKSYLLKGDYEDAEECLGKAAKLNKKIKSTMSYIL